MKLWPTDLKLLEKCTMILTKDILLTGTYDLSGSIQVKDGWLLTMLNI